MNTERATEAELDYVVGGDTALQHEGVHASQSPHRERSSAVWRF
jgi:hypothetical protein